jgi:hypothetical protein
VSNRVTLAQLHKLDAAEIANLPVAQFEMLLEELTALQDRTKMYADKLHAGMNAAFAARASECRRAEGKDTGTVRFVADDFVIVADLPKKVEWDQAELARAREVVASWGENVSDYIDTKLSVAEKRYTAWPATIRKVFEKARTVSSGKPTYKIEVRKQEAA